MTEPRAVGTIAAMQTPSTIRRAIGTLDIELKDAEEAVQSLAALKAGGPLSKRDAAKLVNARARRTELRDEQEDLRSALDAALEFEATAAGEARREAIKEALRKVEAFFIVLELAAAEEDKALAMVEAAVQNRVQWHGLLRAAVGSAVKLLPDYGEQQRERLWMGLSMGLSPASGGIGEVLAWRLIRTLKGAELEQLVQINGVSFDPAVVELSVATAVANSKNALLRRLDAAMQAEGFETPPRDEPRTLAHAASLLGIGAAPGAA